MDQVLFRVHAIARMFQYSVSEEDVRQILLAGEVIQQYLEDRPYPSRLVLGWHGSRPIHVVAAYNVDDRETIVITVYEPDPDQWEPDFRRKRP